MIALGFENSYGLLLFSFLPILILLNINTVKVYRILFTLRFSALILVILSISQLFVYIPAEKGNFVVVLDKSSSMTITDIDTNRANLQFELYREILTNLNDQDEVTLIYFSDTVEIIKLKGEKKDIEIITINESYSGSTKIYNALQRAISLSDTGSVIFILTDGRDNGLIDPIEAAGFAKDKNIVIHTLGIGREDVYDVGISRVTIPHKSVLVNDIFTVQVQITNYGSTKIIPVTLDKGASSETKEVLVESHSSGEVTFNLTAANQSGLMNLRASIPTYTLDIFEMNNEMNFSIYVKDTLYLLYVDNGLGWKTFYETGRLNDSTFVVSTHMNASSFEEGLKDKTLVLTDYDAIFMNPKSNLSAYFAYRSYDEINEWPNTNTTEFGLYIREYTIERGSSIPPSNDTWDQYQFMALILSDINDTHIDSLADWIYSGGSLAIGVQAGLGNSSFVPQNKESSADGWGPYLSWYDPITSDNFSANTIQPNVKSLLEKLGIYDYENIDTTETIVEINDNISTRYYEEFYPTFNLPWGGGTRDIRLFPNPDVDNFQNISLSTVFTNYSEDWTPIFTYYTNLTNLLMREYLNETYSDSLFTDTPKWSGINASKINGKPVAIERNYGAGSIYVFGVSQESYAKYGAPYTIFAPVWAIGARYSFQDTTLSALKNYVQDGGGIIYIGSSPDSEMGPLLPAHATYGVETLGTYYSNITMNHTIVDGLYSDFSEFSLSTYEIITPKLMADVVAKIQNDSLLMTWQYGLGRTIQFASDPTSSWASSTGEDSFLNWAYYRQFWEQCIKWVSRNTINTRIMNVETDKTFYEVGETIQVNVVGVNQTVSVWVSAPVFTSIEQVLFSVDPTDTKKSTFYVTPDVPGKYIFTVTKTIDQTIQTVSCAVTVLDTIEEFSNPSSDFSALFAIANETGGVFISYDQKDTIKEYMNAARYPTKKGKINFWPYFTTVALVFFFLELAFRWRYI